MFFFLFAPQHSRRKGCSWPKRSDRTGALSTLLVILGDSFAGALSVQKRSTGGDWSQDPPDLDFLYVSTLQFSKSFLLLSSFPRRRREAEGTALSPRAESCHCFPKRFFSPWDGGKKDYQDIHRISHTWFPHTCLDRRRSSWCHSTCRQGDLRGSTLHVLTAKPSPNLSFISSHVSTANLDSLTQMENGLTESGCYRCLSYISECSTRSTGQRPYMHRITRTFGCLYEVKNLLRLLSDWQ